MRIIRSGRTLRKSDFLSFGLAAIFIFSSGPAAADPFATYDGFCKCNVEGRGNKALIKDLSKDIEPHNWYYGGNFPTWGLCFEAMEPICEDHCAGFVSERMALMSTSASRPRKIPYFTTAGIPDCVLVAKESMRIPNPVFLENFVRSVVGSFSFEKSYIGFSAPDLGAKGVAGLTTAFLAARAYLARIAVPVVARCFGLILLPEEMFKEFQRRQQRNFDGPQSHAACRIEFKSSQGRSEHPIIFVPTS